MDAVVSDGVYVGRAGADGARNQGWLLGHFMPPGELLHSDTVEVKWGVHPPGERRAAWATQETRTALLVLIRGSFHIELRDRTVLLSDPGDYVVWGPGNDHSWQAGELETVVLTVRWPSVPGWRLPGHPAETADYSQLQETAARR
ncbi:signal peptidase I [Actinoplanes sp. NPDC051859]|uniref:signal peptidase I n=1 Tax=Actinoplanes sp. NPDC051859 TaxID=3363909 RepID=UPI0037988D3B